MPVRLHSGNRAVWVRERPGLGPEGSVFIPVAARFRSGCCPVSFRESPRFDSDLFFIVGANIKHY